MIKEKYIDDKYLKEVDKNIEMIPLTFDIVFKGVFERNKDILKKFLINTLDLKLDIDSAKIEILNNELIKENVLEYQKRVDILVVLNDTIYIDIEINRSNFEKVKKRNSLYCDKLYSMLLDMGDKTTKLNDIYLYQLNLNTKDLSITYGEDIIVSYSLVTKSIYIKNKYTYLKYLEFYRNLYYTNRDDLKENEMWLVALTSRNFSELNYFLSYVLNDEDRSRLVKETIRMSRWTFNLHEWNKEKIDELMRDEEIRINNEEKERALKEGHDAGHALGRAEGRVEGRIEGITQNTKAMILSMIENKIDMETISKITNKTIEEINKIIEE